MANAMSVSTLTAIGGMKTTVMLKEDLKGNNYGQFVLSSSLGTVWVRVSDQEMYERLVRNTHKGTQVEVTGKLFKVSVEEKDGEQQVAFNVSADHIRFINNFGSEYVRKQTEKVSA